MTRTPQSGEGASRPRFGFVKTKSSRPSGSESSARGAAHGDHARAEQGADRCHDENGKDMSDGDMSWCRDGTPHLDHHTRRRSTGGAERGARSNRVDGVAPTTDDREPH